MSVRASSSTTRVVSFNTLAQVYCKSDFFPWAPKAVTRWKNRFTALCDYLDATKFDIAALQEVDNFNTQWLPYAKKNKYGSHYVQRTQATNAKKDGSCVLWRDAAFELVSTRALEYNALADAIPVSDDAEGAEGTEADPAKRYIRDCVANLTLLRQKSDGAEVLVACTHIYWDPACADVKLAQTKMLLEVAEQFRAERQELTKKKVHFICAGDFNSMPTSDVYQALAKNLRSVSQGCEPAYTNVTPSFTECIDYIFVSSDVNVVNVQEQPSRESLGEGLPNASHPSDHLPVIADIQFMCAP